MLNSKWANYKNSINFKDDLKGIFFRSHDRHAVLDGARAITILLMVLFHCVYGIARLLDDKVDVFIQSYPAYLNWTWQIQGSDPLFVMCGLLVSYSLFREYDKNGQLNIGWFYKNRIMRILPLFLFALLFYMPTDDDNINYLLSNVFFVSNFFPDHDQIIPVGWSLSVQMQFYLILPAIVWLLFSVRWPVFVLIVLLLGSFMVRYAVVASDSLSYEIPFFNILYDKEYGHLLSDALYYDIEDRIGSFIVGVLVAYLYLYHGEKITAFLRRHFFVNMSLLCVATIMIVIPLIIPVHDRTSMYYENFSETISFWYLVVNRYIYSLGIGMILLLALCPAGISRIIEKFFSLAIWHPIAQLIFPIYLFHFPFIVVGAIVTFWTLDKNVLLAIQPYQVFIIYGWAVLFTVLFSVLLHIFLEKPFLTMRSTKCIAKNAQRKYVLQS